MAIEYTPRVLVIDYKVPVKLDEANTTTEFYDLGDNDSFVDKIRTVAKGFFDDPTDDMADYFERCIQSGTLPPQYVLPLALTGLKNFIVLESMKHRK